MSTVKFTQVHMIQSVQSAACSQVMQEDQDISRSIDGCNQFAAKGMDQFMQWNETHPEWPGHRILYNKDPTGAFTNLDFVEFRANQLVVYRADLMHSGGLVPDAIERYSKASRLMHQIFYGPKVPRKIPERYQEMLREENEHLVEKDEVHEDSENIDNNNDNNHDHSVESSTRGPEL